MIDAGAMPDMDLTAVQTLEDLYNELKGQGIILGMCGASGHLRQLLKDMSLTTRIGGLLYNDVSDVIETLKAVPAVPPTKPPPK